MFICVCVCVLTRNVMFILKNRPYCGVACVTFSRLYQPLSKYEPVSPTHATVLCFGKLVATL